MASKNTVFHTVIERFPDARDQIIELYYHSDFFRSICEDYADCIQVIKRLEVSGQMIKKGYKKEYEILLKDLESELISKLKECEDHDEENKSCDCNHWILKGRNNRGKK